MSDYLLVPTNLQAFLVGKTDPHQTLYDVVRVPRTKDDLLTWYVKAKYSFSFENKLQSPLKPGVHLHWALPSALTHARHYERKLEQPCIPNRWLVLRMWRAENGSTVSSKGWVIESDFLHDNDEFGGAPLLFSGDQQFVGAPTLSSDPSLSVKYAGHTEPLESWQEAHPAYRFDLKSFGGGDPSFAAYYPACRGVLGFHDSLDGVATGDLLSYLVLGWYSETGKDPLHHPSSTPDTIEKCAQRLARLLWSCSKLQDGSLPQGTLCHGAVVNIKWQGPTQWYSTTSAGSSPAQHQIVIGDSADDALATFLARQGDEALQRALRAFYYGQAEEVRDEFQLGELLHHHSFNTAPGGRRWSVEPATQSSEAPSMPLLMSPDVQKGLASLNEAQRRLDKQKREIESLRWQLFACWVAWASKQTGVPKDRPGPDKVNQAASALQQAENKLPSYEVDVTDRRNDVNAALKNEALQAKKTGMQLAESTMPPFLHPKDPFIVLKGEKLTGIERTRPQRPVKNAAGELLLHCRRVNEIVSGVSLSDVVQVPRRAAECFNLNFPHQSRLAVGEVAHKLALETLLFNPVNAGVIVGEDDVKLLPDFKELQRTLERSASSGKIECIGQPPDPLGITRWNSSAVDVANKPGENPWLPVFMLWQANWAYAHAKDSGSSHALKGWTLSVDPLAGDLVLEPKNQQMQLEGPSMLQGGTIIGGLSGRQLAANLRKFAESEGLKVNSLPAIDETAVLGQSLGGFNDLLIRQTMGFCLPPVRPTGKTPATIDLEIWKATGSAPQPTMPSTGRFFPLRAGNLTLLNLYVVDAFGQTRKLIDSSNSKPNVIASAELQPRDKEICHASFRPRLIQPARLNFDWTPGADGSGPLCGWLVPNFLEKSLAVFSSSGAPLGALESVLPALGEKTIQSKIKFNWQKAPGSSLAIADLPNEPLQHFLELISNLSTDQGQAFLELVELVLRKTEERQPSEDPRLAVLFGRPLAVVQASLGLELQGLPTGYWTTGSTWKFETQAFEGLRVPVRLGGMDMTADGLVGYLQGGTAPFFASYGATRRVSESKWIKYDQELTVSPADKPQLVTLLMDASARVHATTGILPRCSIELPAEVGKQLAHIEHVYFNVAPVLGPRPQGDQAPIIMPRPSDAFGRWSWATRPALAWREIRPADDRARFDDDLALCEGWLKLRLRPEG